MESIFLGKYKNKNLEWNVIYKSTDGAELVILKDCTFKRAYHDKEESVDWSHCSLRKWLNSEFYDASFSFIEKSLIIEHSTKDNYDDNFSSHADTIDDRIFILSHDNLMVDYNYRFSIKNPILLRGFGRKYQKIFVLDNGKIKDLSVNDSSAFVFPAMWIKRRSLYECMSHEIECCSTIDFLKDDSKSSEYIKKILRDQNYTFPQKGDLIYDIAKGRARHSAVTYLLGLILKKIYIFDESFIPKGTIIADDKTYANNIYMWLRTALYHDIGMTSELIMKRNLDLEKDFKHYLYTEEYSDLIILNNYIANTDSVLAYTYSEILDYGEYIVNERHPLTNEKDEIKYKSRGIIDHGVLGGAILFDKYADKLSDTELKLLKVISLTISQHNMYKAEPEDDYGYEKYGLRHLLSTSSFRITSKTPLLLFLSLVDTIECVKTFSKGNNPETYLETITVLKSIFISIDKNTIRIDYSQLKRLVHKKGEKLKKTYSHYIQNVMGLEKWTSFKVNSIIEDEVLEITVPTTKSVNYRDY